MCSQRGAAQESTSGFSAATLCTLCTCARSYAACGSGPCARGYRSNQLEADDALWRMHANHADAEPRGSEVYAERTARIPHGQVAAADTFPAGAAAAGIDANGAASGVRRPKAEGVPTAQLGLRTV